MSRKRPINFSLDLKDIAIFVILIIALLEAAFIIQRLPKKIKFVELPTEKAPSKEYKIAIVLDDWGYNIRNISFLKDIDVPFTVSILPNLRYSQYIADAAKENSKEVIIHLPLEPYPGKEVGLEKNVILINMPQQKIVDIINQAIKSVPYAIGASNHMGSKATENHKIMAAIFEEFKPKNLFFFDSLVTADSVCERTAREVGIKFAKRDVFLDNENDADYIRHQLRLLVQKAKQNGLAIGIGHDRPLTLQTIKDSIDELKKEGIRFVFLSDLVN